MLLVALAPAAGLKAFFSGARVSARSSDLTGSNPMFSAASVARPFDWNEASVARPFDWNEAVSSLNADAMEPLYEQSTADPVARPIDPLAKAEAAKKKKKVNDFKLNVGEAIDSLNTDIPQILVLDPNWDIFTEDLELDMESVDPIAFRLIGGVLGLMTRRVRGLDVNKKALSRLQKFCGFYVKSSEVRIKIWLTPGSLVTFPDGKEGIIVRWNARLKMKSDMELIPSWASTSIRFIQKSFSGFSGMFDSMSPGQERLIVVDSVSRFYFDAEGRINRHVIDSIDLLPPLTMPAVDEMLYMVGLGYRSPRPALAYGSLNEGLE